MKKIYIFTFLVLLLISGFNNRANASHVLGGEITWTCVGQDSFLVKLVVYNDCNGVNLSSTPISFKCATSGTSITTLSLAVTTPHDITPVCRTSCSRCTSYSCSFPYGISSYTMQGIVVLSSAGSCCQIRISWDQCCRGSYYTTIYFSGSFYIESILNRCQNPRDNSPSFVNQPLVVLCVGQDVVLDFRVVDSDIDSNGVLLDSITYEMTPPLEGYNLPRNYNSQYTYAKPFYFLGFPNALLGFPQGLRFDSQTGEMQFRPTKPEVTAVVVKVNEFRNGIKIGEVRREIQVIVMNCSSGNTAPSVTTPDKIKTKSVCVGDTVSFNFLTNDPNSNDSVFISWNNNIKGANWTDSNGLSKHPSAKFTWVPAANQARTQPYFMYIKAKDNGCPIPGQYTDGYWIQVKANLTTSYSVTDSGCGYYLFSASAIKDPGAGFNWGGSINYYRYPKLMHRFLTPGIYPFSLSTYSIKYCGSAIYDTLVVEPFLWIKVPNDTAVCLGSTVDLNIQSFDSRGKIRYKWSTGDTTASITVKPLISTWYKVVVTDSLSCPAIDSVYIQVYPQVKVNEDYTVCIGQEVSLSASPGFNSYNWNSGDTSRSITKYGTSPVLYYVWATDNHNCMTSDSVFVNVYPLTSIDAGVDTSICSINGFYELKGSPDTSSGGTGIWSGTAVAQDAINKWYFDPNSYDVSNRITYRLTFNYNDSFGCKSSDSVNIKVYNYNNITTGKYTPLCIDGDSIVLNGFPAGGYWQGSVINGSTFDPKLAGLGNHMVTYTINDYCVFSDTTYISVVALPFVQIGTFNGRTEFCPTQGMIALYGSPAGGPYGGVWSGDVEPYHYFNTTRTEGTYSVIYTFKSLYGCINADTLFLKVGQPKIKIETSQKEVCFGNLMLLKAKFNIADSLRWTKAISSNGYFVSSSSDSEVYYIPGPNDYSNGGLRIKVKTFGGLCNSVSDSIYIKTGYIPKTNFSADLQTGYFPLQVNFTDLSTIQAGSISNYNWDFGDGNYSMMQNPVNTFLSAGSYDVKLTIVSDIGCKDSLTKKSYIVTTTSVPEARNDVYMMLFPNPATDYIDVSYIGKGYNIAKVNIYNASGTLIHKQNGIDQNSVRIDTRNFKSGLYLLRVVSDKGNEYLAKFVKD